MKARSDDEALRAYAALYKALTARGSKPNLNILDNEASRAIKRAINKSGATYQLVEPHNHRVNAAERAIRTFKNHVIAGLCSTDPSFPVSIWDKLVLQAVLTLNLLRTSRLNPKLSAYNQLFGVFDFNRTPLAPPGTRAVIFEDPDTRESWAPHGKLAWYLGPAPEHYRCYRLYIPETGGIRTSGTVDFFPHYSTVPKLSSADAAAHAARDLIVAIENPYPKTSFPRLSTRHLTALKLLANIFRTATAADTQDPSKARAHEGPSDARPLEGPSKARTQQDPSNAQTPVRRVDAPVPRVAAPVPRVEVPPAHNPTERFQPRPPTHRYPTRNRSLFAASAVHELMRREAHHSLQQHANAVLHPTTGKPMSYEQLMKDPVTKTIWL
jgi:hypothetical protein